MINDFYALKKWTHRISFFYCAVPLGHFCHVPCDFLCKFSMVCHELLFRNLLDQIWSQTDASCGCDPFVLTFTDSEHRLSTLIFHELCHAAAIVCLAFRHQWWAQYWLLFRAGSVSPSPSCSCILSGLYCTKEQGARSGTQTIQGMSLSFVSRARYQYGLWQFTISCTSSSGLFLSFPNHLLCLTLVLTLLWVTSQGRKG